MMFEDGKDLESRLRNFSLGDDESMVITRIEAQFLARCANFTLNDNTGMKTVLNR